MKNLIRKGILLSLITILFATTTLAQRKAFYVSPEERTKTEQQLKQGREFKNSDIYLRFEVLDKPSGMPLSGLEVKLQNENGDICRSCWAYGKQILINPYVDTTDANGIAVFPLQKDHISDGKLNNVRLSIKGNYNYFQKQVQFNLGNLINGSFRRYPIKKIEDSASYARGLEFLDYSFFPVSPEQDSAKTIFSLIKNYNINHGDYTGILSRFTWILPLKVEMERIPAKIHLDQK